MLVLSYLYGTVLNALALFSFDKYAGNSGEIRVTCIGDSITEGGACGAPSYTNNLQEILGDGYAVTNCGVSGMTMLKKGLCGDPAYGNQAGACSWWNTWAYSAAMESEPDIVTIMLGTNDAKYYNWEGAQQNWGDYYTLDYVDLIHRLRALKSHPKIYILVPPPIYAPYPYDMNGTIVNQIYPILERDLASVVGAEIIDIYSAMVDTGVDNTCDGCHPTETGANIIAQTIADAILGKTHGDKPSSTRAFPGPNKHRTTTVYGQKAP